jgi:hypothetical protein
MNADEYLQRILAREAVDTGPYSPVRGVQAVVEPVIRYWAGGCLIDVCPSGSFAKGTANQSGTDIDLFISLSEITTGTLKEVYEGLFSWMNAKGFSPKRQNVSINIRVNGYDVDLVPARRQGAYGDDHSLYRRRADTWTKTNVHAHIHYVIGARRINETRVVKLWRNQMGLDFPSFYLELTVISALAYARGNLSQNVIAVFQYLRDSFPSARVVDPVNTNNIVSDDLSSAERAAIASAAKRALASDWNQIIT